MRVLFPITVMALLSLGCNRVETFHTMPSGLPRGASMTVQWEGEPEVAMEVQRTLRELGFQVATRSGVEQILTKVPAASGTHVARRFETPYACFLSGYFLEIVDTETGRVRFVLAQKPGEEMTPRSFAAMLRLHLKVAP